MRPRMLFVGRAFFYDIHPMERRLRSPCFGRTAHLLWGGSAALIVAAFAAFGGGSALSLAASLVGVTSLIFNAKSHPVGQALVFVRVLRRNDCLPGHDRADGRRAGRLAASPVQRRAGARQSAHQRARAPGLCWPTPPTTWY